MRALTTKEEAALYKICLIQGLDLTFKRLTLCNLENYRHGEIKNRKWQVFCDDKRFEWYKTYDEIEPAVNKFLEIKHFLGGNNVKINNESEVTS